MTQNARTVVPGIVLIGGMRCGTSTIYHHLARHPQVHKPDRKESHFFDLHYDRGWQWYEDRLGSPRPGQVVFEATPSYLSDPAAVDRIARDLPAARLIVSFRDPVARAHSHYWFNVMQGREERDFEQAIHDEMDEGHSTNRPPTQRRYLSGGMYGPQLRYLFQKVPRDRLSPLIFEEYTTDPVGVMAWLIEELGLEGPTRIEPPPASNAYRRMRSKMLWRLSKAMPRALRGSVENLALAPDEYPDMAPSIRTELDRLFAASTAELMSLLDRDLSGLWPSVGSAG